MSSFQHANLDSLRNSVMTDKNENGDTSQTPFLWTMQSNAARKRILNSCMTEYLHKETKIDGNIDSLRQDSTKQHELTESDDTPESLLLQSPYPKQDKAHNVILLDDFLRYLSVAYIGSNSLNSRIDWHDERYYELFSNLIDVDIDCILPILTEIPSINNEIFTRDCNTGDSFQNIFLQTPYPELMEPNAREYDKPFSIKVELTLKNSKSSLNGAEQSDVVHPEYEMVETNKSDSLNTNLKCERTILERNRVKCKLLSKPRGRLMDRINTVKSDNILEKDQQENTVTSHLSDNELNKRKRLNISLGKSNQKPKGKNDFENEIKSKKCNLIIAKGKKLHSPPNSSYDDDIEINVYNSNKVLKKFSFSQNLLISKMGYFAQVASTKNLQDFKITVHSDHNTFKWILAWIKNDSAKLKLSAKPDLNCLNVTPLLISAFVFKITSLMEYCLNFYVYNLNDIIKYTSDLRNLDDEIISRLAAKMSNVELSRVEDAADKITSRLYSEMIMALAQSKPEPSRGHFVTFPLVYKCALCNKIVLKKHSNNIMCLPEQQGIDYKGNVIVNHKIDTGWNITTYVKNLMKKYGSWEKVYWNMWAECHFLKCSRCNEYYSIKYSKHCSTHTKNPIFKSLSNKLVSPEGIYLCCGAKVYRFDVRLLQRHTGCKTVSHSPVLEGDRSYSDIQKIYTNMKSLISTDRRFDRVKNDSHGNALKLTKLPKIKAIPNNLFHLQPSNSEYSYVGLLDKNLLKVESYQKFNIKAWQDCQELTSNTSCLRNSSKESLSDYSTERYKQEKIKSSCPQTSRKHAVEDVGALSGYNLESSRDVDEDSSASLSVAEEMKVQRYKIEQENVLQSILKSGRIPERTVEKIERKLKKSMNVIRPSLKINQDNLRDYEDRLTSEVNDLLCQRTNSRSACLLDRFPHINLDTVVKNDQSSNTGDKSTNIHPSDSEISIGSSVKTYCSTISSSTRICHSRKSNVWSSFTPLAGSFVRVEAEWQDTFNATMPPSKTKTGRKQTDDSVYINCFTVGSQAILESKIGKRKTLKSVNGKRSVTLMKRSWKALAPKSKISEIESYLSTTVLPTRQQSPLNTTNLGISKMDQQQCVPSCEGKHNTAFTCGFTGLVNNDSLMSRINSKESDYVNPIWMYDKRYKELDYLSCIYMPIPFHKDYEVVKGVDWPRLRVLENEWRSFLKFMKIDENFESFFHHSAIKPYYNTNVDKRRRAK